MKEKIKLIAAISSNGVIGNAGELVFSDKEDLKHFKETTEGATVVMGRKTWDSIPKAYRPLKGRKNVVISKSWITHTEESLTIKPEGNISKEILNHIIDEFNSNLFIIGGGQIYEQTIPFADELIISEFPQEVTGDTFFPEIDMNIWKIKEEKPFTNFVLKIYERK